MIRGLIDIYVNRWDFFLGLAFEHIYITLIAVVIVSILGISIGIGMTYNDKIATVILGLISFLYTIPSIALFGILISITGIGKKSAVLALIIYGLLPITRATYVGIKEVDQQMIEAAIGMGSTKWQLLYKIQVPQALPIIMNGFRTMVVMVIALGGIAAFIGAGGLGVAIYRGINTYNPEMIVAGSLLVALFALLADWTLGRLEKKLTNKVLGRK